MKSMEFIGTSSGDGESFCWEVDVETFKQIVGREPDGWDYVDKKYAYNKDGDIGFYNLSELVRLYPDSIFRKDTPFERYGETKNQN